MATRANVETLPRGHNTNEQLLAVVRQQIATRGVLFVVCTLLSTSAAVFWPPHSADYWAVVFVPLGLALVVLLFFLDAVGHWREIKGRNWVAATPRFDERRFASDRKDAAHSSESPQPN
jgi:hypothetical protein